VQIDNNNGKCFRASSTVNGPGWAFTMTNATTGNSVIAFTRNPGGTLTQQGVYPTGGNGSGFLTDSQGSIIVSPDRKFVFAVNAGDGSANGSVTSFVLSSSGLTRVSTVDSGGKFPLSLTYHNGLLYVLDEGGVPDPEVAGNIQGFTVAGDGTLTAIPGSAQTTGKGPRQIGFDNTGSVLLVTTRSDTATAKFSNIYTYPVNANGLAGTPTVTPSSGAIPFGFSFDQRNHAIVSDSGLDEALNVVGPAGVSTYSLAGTAVTPITGLAGNGNPLTCWAVIAYKPTGEYTYTTNPVGNTFNLTTNPPMLGPGDESIYKIAPDGTATLINARTGTITSQVANFAVDEDVSSDSRYLYVLSMSAPPPNPDNGSVTVFRINGDGSLTQVQTIDFPTSQFGFTGMAAT
jgi:6-phosphogluconolactonase (cycloisomerase 2 family)